MKTTSIKHAGPAYKITSINLVYEAGNRKIMVWFGEDGFAEILPCWEGWTMHRADPEQAKMMLPIAERFKDWLLAETEF